MHGLHASCIQLLLFTGLASGNLNEFREELYKYWFQLYSRSRNGPLESSGFEHVFLGEIRAGGDAVTGYHNWVKFYTNERDGEIKLRSVLRTCQVLAII